MKWTKELEEKCFLMRGNKSTYKEIAKELGTTESSVKHKVRRISQSNNEDKYKHTKEKVEILDRFLIGSNLKVLETNSGFGGLSEFYSGFGHVECYDIDEKRVRHVNSIGSENIDAFKGDSEKEVIRLLHQKRKYDIVDIDPYGMPSRYFPYVFGLIDKGILSVTLPMIGVAQMNKITIEHLMVFWGVDYKDKESYVDKVIERMSDYAFMQKRSISVLDVSRIDRIYRITLSVEKKSLCDIVGLKVNR